MGEIRISVLLPFAMTEQFSTRGVSRTRIESRLIRDRLDPCRFMSGTDDKESDESIFEIRAFLRRFMPKASLLGSCPRVSKLLTKPQGNNSITQCAESSILLFQIRRNNLQAV
jgi:hypothetical protein